MLDGLDATAFWKLGGNGGTSPGTHFLGTTDFSPLEFKVNGLRVGRLELPGDGAPNVVFGAPFNFVAPFTVGCTIAGGGATNLFGLARTNSILSSYGTVGGGVDNRIAPGAAFGVIAGGFGNDIGTNTPASVIGGGQDNYIAVNAEMGTIGGGSLNTIGANSAYGTIGGGVGNQLLSGSIYSTIAGGNLNDIGANASFSAVGGGGGNHIGADSAAATIAGGFGNNIGTNSARSAIGGGFNNTVAANSQSAVIPGGADNAAASYAFAAGRRAKANHTGSFVWSDSTGLDLASTTNDSLTMRASGGYRLFSNTAADAGVALAPGDTAWSVLSDRNRKKDFAPMDSVAVLEKLAALPITRWHYQWEEADATPHLGPMAQDFKAAFYPGRDNTVITTLEADGVALAAIQGLNEKVESGKRKAETSIQELKAENAELKARLERLEQLLNAKNGGGR